MTPKEREVELEYDEPFALVVKGYAAMRYNKKDTAFFLGFSQKHFANRVLPRHDPHGEIVWKGAENGAAS